MKRQILTVALIGAMSAFLPTALVAQDSALTPDMIEHANMLGEVDMPAITHNAAIYAMFAYLAASVDVDYKR